MNIKGLCEKLQITQVEFARRIGVSTQTLHNWSTGKSEPTVGALRVIHNTFDISARWLLMGVGEVYLSSIDTKNREVAPIDEKLLTSVVEGVERFLASNPQMRPTFEQKGQLIAAVYRHFIAMRNDDKIINFQSYLDDNLTLLFESLKIMH
ncbi:MAG: helix-turn-helix domain-containing protein [Deferribacteraceae bacterium]|jgi:transcriptional regulator with XRE-family HTH domain|nr:helix-turn-helix domain-containing protein [Deferribacteraceae bacterium]